MPYRPDERQYRNLTVSDFKPEVRESSDTETYVVSGYFSTFNQEYPLFDDFYESVDPGAFRETDMSDVVLQLNHDGFVYARSRNGSLTIDFDEHGAHCVADLSGTKQGREDLYEAITNGLIDTMSFGFVIADDGVEWEEDENGIIHSRITKVSKLYDVSPIAGFAANPNTEISARSLHDSIIEARERIATEKQAEEQRLAEEAAEEQRLTDIARRKRRAKAMMLNTI